HLEPDVHRLAEARHHLAHVHLHVLAIAVDHHGPTIRWAQRRRGDLDDLHLVEADVMAFDRPRVDLVAALNFSTFIYHTPDALRAYLRHARRCLRPGGHFVLDVYGGPGAQRCGTQTRPADGFVYHWEQRRFDPLTHRTDCRIHFTLPDGRRLKSAFRYDWRLWTLPELTGLMQKAGFGRVDVWTANRAGRVVPAKAVPAADDWVAYLVGTRTPPGIA
ncbi:MAG: class I SAM-dependent methyltransferase, partial [Planctomycetota bacterium]